jgi:HD-GYP domain-containing protein (c-di-GMP phosphodiesterase class II)
MLLALAAKNSALCEHSVHVAITATDIAALIRGNGFEASLLNVHDTFITGLIHDMGKLSIDDSILTKKGSLNSQEREIMRNHTQWGYGLASKIEEISHLANYVLQHHERPGGKGYPGGLDTEDIMLTSRILNISDRFAGMLVDRPYRKGIPAEQIIPVLEEDIVDFFGDHAIDIIDTLLSIGRHGLESATNRYLMAAGIL